MGAISSEPIIQVVDVVQHYGVRPVLRKVSLDVHPHELLSIVGPNGMGKSTLLGVISGALSPQSGHVVVDGLRRKETEERELEIRRRIAWLPDHPWLPKERTGREFLLSVGGMYGVEPLRLFEHIDRLLDVFDLAKQGDWAIRSYSNGQQKKIAVCGALVSEAPILLLDEPFSGGLDPAGILALKKVLRGLVERRRATIVMTSPVPEILEELADRIVVLREGNIVICDTPDAIKRTARTGGSLAEALARLMHPETVETVERYFASE